MKYIHKRYFVYKEIFTMPPIKTAILNLRIDPKLKEAVQKAAEKEHRSVANFIEQLIRDYCAKNRIPVPK